MRLALVPVTLALISLAPQAPFGNLGDRPAKPPAVTFLYPEKVTIQADKLSLVDLHFRVGAGLHINSHTPRSEELIPTTIKLPETSGVRLAKADFPPGTDFAFSAGQDTTPEKVSVYTGEFVVRAELIATKGDHPVEATLHYQACTHNICMPPHSIPVAFDVIAK
jgi:hypothetical protein